MKLCLTGHLTDTCDIIDEVHLCQVIVGLDIDTVLHHLRDSPINLRCLIAIFRDSWYWSHALTISINVILSLIVSPPRRVWWLIARSIILGVNPVAFKGGNLEIDSTKLDNVTDAHDLRLVIREKVLQHLVDRPLFTDDEPHRPAQVDIILLILVSLALRFRFLMDSSDHAILTAWRRYFVKQRLV